MNIRRTIGLHDMGLTDPGRKIELKEILGSYISADEAHRLSEDHKGAELLVEHNGFLPDYKLYTVYALELEGTEGRALTSVDLFENVELDPHLGRWLGGRDAIISPANEASAQGTKDQTTFWKLNQPWPRPSDSSLGKAWKGVKESLAFGMADLADLASGHPNPVSHWARKELVEATQFEHQAHELARLKREFREKHQLGNKAEQALAPEPGVPSPAESD